MINSNVCDNNGIFYNTEMLKRNSSENDDGMFYIFSCLSIFIIYQLLKSFQYLNLTYNCYLIIYL